MSPNVLAVLALSEIKAAIAQFESGDENAFDTVAKILDACKATSDSASANCEAA